MLPWFVYMCSAVKIIGTDLLTHAGEGSTIGASIKQHVLSAFVSIALLFYRQRIVIVYLVPTCVYD